MKNLEIAQIFERIADILEFKGENRFKINAYRKASRIIGSLSEDIEHIHKENRLMDIPGVGSGIAEKIAEFLDTGKMSKYEETMKGIEEGLIKLMDISGIGPSTLRTIHKELGIKDIDGLEKAASEGRLQVLKGMGEKKEENILRGIRLFKESQKRISIGTALPLVKEIIDSLKKKTGVKEIEAAGSLRRMKETVGDIDILASGSNGKEIISAFVNLPIVKEVLSSGETKGSVIAEGNIQVDLRVVERESFGAALQYFTGSKLHNIHLRDMAKNLNFLIVDLKKCLDNSSRSAIIQRNNYTLILYKGISEKNKVVTLGIFLTKNYIVTVHKSSITSLNNIQSITLAETPTNIVKNGINYLLHQITEEIGREYFKLFDEIDDELDKLEEKIFKKTKANIMQEIFAVKKVVIYSRQALHANRDALNDLEKIFQPTDREMIHQLHNDIIQLIDENNLYHERLTGVVDAYLTKQSNDLNEIMKSFTVIASLILLPTLIAGAYGMNLVLPLRDHPQGFWILLGIMIVGVVLMLFFFKKKEWV